MRRSHHVVGLILLTFFVISFLTNIIGPLVPEIIEDFHLSLTLVAVLPFAFFIAYGVMSIPAGLLIEKYQEKPVMVAAFVVAFVGASLLALFPNAHAERAAIQRRQRQLGDACGLLNSRGRSP